LTDNQVDSLQFTATDHYNCKFDTGIGVYLIHTESKEFMLWIVTTCYWFCCCFPTQLYCCHRLHNMF